MKKATWSRRTVVCIVLASGALMVMVVQNIYSSLTRAHQIQVICDAQLAPLATEKLSSWCKTHPEVIEEPQKLVDAFSFIKSCDVRYTKIKNATIHVVPHIAVAVLNEKYLLLSNGSVVEAAYYVYQPTACFTVQDTLSDSAAQCKALVNAVRTMAPQLFDQYLFSWRDSTVCTVTDKTTGRMVVADDRTVCDRKKIETGMELAENTYVADIRFDQQIIVAKKRGGDEVISRC